MLEAYKIGVVGAGNMGGGIAQKMAQEGLQVVIVDINEAGVERGLGIIKNTLEQGMKRKVFTQAQVDATLSRIKGTTNMEKLADCDLIVEAVFEDMEVKGQLFKHLDGICQPKTIFATNTSSLSVAAIAAYTDRQDRVVGMHYFYHPAKNRLLEVIPHAGTSKETLDKAMLIGKLHSKTNILVKDSPGFAINRFFIPYYVEAVRIFEQGVANIPTIEVAAKEAYGFTMGPFELMNVTGIPIAVHSANTLYKEIGDFYAPPELLKKQMEMKVDFDLSGEVDQTKLQIVKDRLLATSLGVATTLVEEGVASIEDTDRGAKIGLAWKVGPFELMNKSGVKKVYEDCVALSNIYPSFKVPKLLKDQANSGKPFEFNLVDLDIKEEIAYITINRPEAMNALNPTVVAQLEKRFDEAEKNPNVKAIALQGAGKAFVAGADIKYFVDNVLNKTYENLVTFPRTGHELLLRIENSPKLTIAIVDGLSLGGGSELALACQEIVATEAGSFGFPEVGIGIYPGLGGMFRMAKQIGTELAKYYVFTGKTIKATEAYELGIVTAITEPAKIEQTIKDLVTKATIDKYRPRTIPAAYNDKMAICTTSNVEKLLSGQSVQGVDQDFAEKTAKIIAIKAPIALRVANELIDAQVKVSIKEAIELELGRQIEIFLTEDALAGLQSPPGKPPTYNGK